MTLTSKLRGFLAACVALIVALMMAMPAQAATITINGNEGETYTAYKVLDVTTSSSGDYYNYTTTSESVANLLEQYGYTVTASSAGNLWYVSLGASTNADDLTEYLAGLTETELTTLLGSSVGNVTIDEGQTAGTIEGLDAGYYFVTSSLGSLCMLNTATGTAEIDEKNDEPTVDKTVSDTDAQIGDTVTYTVTIDVPANTENLSLSDTLSDGLTLNETSFTISVDNGTAHSLTVSPVSNEDGTTTFTVDLTSYLTGGDCTIVVTYTATINENAAENPATNEAKISYGNSSSTSSTTKTETHSATIKKTDSQGDALNGAEFTLKDSEGNLIYVVAYGDNGDYRVATSDEVGATTTIEVNGSVTIYGLDAEDYTLTETKAPDGYNLLDEDETLTVKADNTGEITVVNEAGSLLPSTGGMGTTILYAVGAVLVIGAGIALIVRRRNHHEC